MTKQVQDLMVEVERICDAFHEAVWSAGDVDAAMALTTTDCTLLHIPAGTGSHGGLRRHLAEDVLPYRPADLTFRQISRTGNRWSVADENLIGFTHDRELPWLLPGVAPTHRYAEVLAITVVTVKRSLISRHRTLWDHIDLRTQLQLDPADVTAGAPTAG